MRMAKKNKAPENWELDVPKTKKIIISNYDVQEAETGN